MRQFFTILAIALVIIGAIFGFTPFFIGTQIESNFQQTMDKVSSKSPYFTLTASNYQRHWFHSTANIQVNIKPNRGLLTTQLPSTLTIPVTIKHGLLIRTPHGLTMGRVAFVMENNSTNFDGRVGCIIKLSGHASQFADIKQINYHDKNGFHLTLSNLAMSSPQHRTGSQQLAIEHLRLHLPGIASSEPALDIGIKALAATVNAKRHQGLYWLGTSTLSIKQLTDFNENSTATPNNQINQLSITLTSGLSRNKKTLNTTMSIAMGSLETNGHVIKPITLNYTMSDINTDAYTTLIKAAQNPKLAQHPIELAPSLFGVLGKGLSFEIKKLYVGLPADLASSALSGTLQGKLTPSDVGKQAATLSQTMSFTSVNPQLFMLPALLLTKHLNVSIHLVLPNSLVKAMLAKRYEKILSRLAATGQTVTVTPAMMVAKAYQYLLDNKMIINDTSTPGALTTDIDFNAGNFKINQQTPKLDLPMPTQATTPHSSTQAHHH